MNLFQKYGGYPTFSNVVQAFYRAVLDSDQLVGYFEGTDMNRLMKHQTDFLATALGGPASYTGRSLRAAHGRLNISEADFALVAELLTDALVDAGVEQQDIDTILSVVAGTKPDIVTSET